MPAYRGSRSPSPASRSWTRPRSPRPSTRARGGDGAYGDGDLGPRWSQRTRERLERVHRGYPRKFQAAILGSAAEPLFAPLPKNDSNEAAYVTNDDRRRNEESGEGITFG